jgi:hypothetical protein
MLDGFFLSYLPQLKELFLSLGIDDSKGFEFPLNPWFLGYRIRGSNVVIFFRKALKRFEIWEAEGASLRPLIFLGAHQIAEASQGGDRALIDPYQIYFYPDPAAAAIYQCSTIKGGKKSCRIVLGA